MTGSDNLIVVYQFGKVASTAIVKSLNDCEGVQAHQCHFLGNDALQRIIPNATNSRTSAYFRKHTVGQLIQNLELTYLVNMAVNGSDGQRLIVVSLSREPLDWLRSCVQQDIEGYKDDLLAFSNERFPGEASIELGLRGVIDCLCGVLSRFGSAQNAIDTLGIGSSKTACGVRDEIQDDFVRKMFLLALRPLVWFDEHFSKCFDVQLCEFSKQGAYWLKETKPSTFVLLRYEDLEDVFPAAMQRVGVPFEEKRLCRANESKNKPFADEIQRAFQGEEAVELRAQLLQSNYAAHFGYQ